MMWLAGVLFSLGDKLAAHCFGILPSNILFDDDLKQVIKYFGTQYIYFINGYLICFKM